MKQALPSSTNVDTPGKHSSESFASLIDTKFKEAGQLYSKALMPVRCWPIISV